MAKKRMFNNDVLDTDAFLEMPLSAQALYFHLNLRADDDGFISNPTRVQRYIGASQDDLSILVAKRFVIAFEDGVIVIKHWRMHNTLRSDRYNPTVYQEDYKMLGLKKNNAYTLDDTQMETKCIPNGNHMATKRKPNGNHMETKCLPTGSTVLDIDIGIDKDIDKELVSNKDIDINKAPTLTELTDYISEKKLNVNPQRFHDYYTIKGWDKVSDWKATLEFWHKHERKSNKSQFLQEQKSDYDMASLEKALLAKTEKEMGNGEV